MNMNFGVEFDYGECTAKCDLILSHTIINS